MADAPDWSWKVADPRVSQELDLLYEPGNWGDVLKGVWAVALAEALAARPGSRGLTLLDPFAGSPTWPLLAGAAARLAELPPSRWSERQRGHVAEGRLASTGLIVLEALRGTGADARALVFDVHTERRERWRSVPGAEVVLASDGEEVLAASAGAADLLLVDSYDLFERWESVLPSALGARPDAAVLLYLYNKAPRGAAAHKEYRRLRERLERLAAERAPGHRLLVGRLACDALLPRAYHEVLLLGPDSLADRLVATLREATLALARGLAEEGAFEEG